MITAVFCNKVLSNARVALENVIKYGILVDPIQWIRIISSPTIWPSVQILLLINVFILNSLWIEKYLLANGVLNELMGNVIISIHMTSIIVIPAYMVYTDDCHPVGSSVALGFVSQVFLKLISYHMVNYWCRTDLRKRFQNFSVKNSRAQQQQLRRYRSFSHNTAGSETDLTTLGTNGDLSEKLVSLYGEVAREKVYYPQNLNTKDIYYFAFVPTLCYELNFPRSQRIRKRFLIRRGFEMVSPSNTV